MCLTGSTLPVIQQEEDGGQGDRQLEPAPVWNGVGHPSKSHKAHCEGHLVHDSRRSSVAGAHKLCNWKKRWCSEAVPREEGPRGELAHDSCFSPAIAPHQPSGFFPHPHTSHLAFGHTHLALSGLTDLAPLHLSPRVYQASLSTRFPLAAPPSLCLLPCCLHPTHMFQGSSLSSPNTQRNS